MHEIILFYWHAKCKPSVIDVPQCLSEFEYILMADKTILHLLQLYTLFYHHQQIRFSYKVS